MGRGKLKMQLISNPKERRRYFERRKKSVEKAAKDLSTLCGVDIGMIFFSSPYLLASCSTSWPGNQQHVLHGLITSAKTSSRIKTCSVSDCLKLEKNMEDEVELDRAGMYAKIETLRRMIILGMKDQETATSRLLLTAHEEPTILSSSSIDHEKLDQAGLGDRIEAVRRRINMLRGETSLFTESKVDHESGPSTWTYEQLQAVGFNCYNNSDQQAMMINYDGGDDDDNMCTYTEPLMMSTYNDVNHNVESTTSYGGGDDDTCTYTELLMMSTNNVDNNNVESTTLYGGDDDMCTYTEPLKMSTNNDVNNNVELTTSSVVGPYDFALDLSDCFTSSVLEDWYLNQESFL